MLIRAAAWHISFVYDSLSGGLLRVGEVYTLGASADGIASMQTPRTDPEWLRGQYIIWATSQMYDTLLPFGAYKQKTAEDWLLGLTMPNPDVVYTNIEILHQNEAHTDFWNNMVRYR